MSIDTNYAKQQPWFQIIIFFTLGLLQFSAKKNILDCPSGLLFIWNVICSTVTAVSFSRGSRAKIQCLVFIMATTAKQGIATFALYSRILILLMQV